MPRKNPPVQRRLSADQARLRPHLRERDGKLPATAALDDVLEAEADQVRRKRDRTVVPSPGELRGLPAVGGGPGAIAGTNPLAALMRKESRRQ
jgi:hypothetical protein